MLGVFSDIISKKIGGRRLGAVLYVFAIVSCIVMMLSYSAVLSVLAIVILRIAYSMYQPLQLELQNQAVVVGPKRALAVSAARIVEPNWLSEVQGRQVMAKVRSLAKPVPAMMDGEWLRFASDEYGVAPGQAAVLYDGERVLGGGWIEETAAALLSTAA